ncbi:MAG: hypothetical protein ACYST6_03740 [Planctomycetota bacterium]|jgi:hypothetical protein
MGITKMNNFRHIALSLTVALISVSVVWSAPTTNQEPEGQIAALSAAPDIEALSLLTGQNILVYWDPNGSDGDEKDNIVSILTGQGATVAETTTTDPNTLAAELAGKDAFVIAELSDNSFPSAGFLAVLDARFTAFEPVISAFLSQCKPVVITEGDVSIAPGIQIINSLGYTSVVGGSAALSTVPLNLDDPANQMLAGISGLDTANGWMGFTSADANLNSVASRAGEMVLADMVVNGAYFRIIGFDYHAYDANMAAVLVNSVQEGCSILPVDVDIKPTSCPNPLNLKSRGVLPVAVLGTESFDVTEIDPASIRLAGVAPLRSSLEDVATPVADGGECDCSDAGSDGLTDLTLKFSTQEIVDALVFVLGQKEYGLKNTVPDILVLTLTGELQDGTPIEGSDCVVLVGKIPEGFFARKADINEDGAVELADLALFKKYLWTWNLNDD